MKYLELPELRHVNEALSKLDIGDLILDGRVEVYSCKMAKGDKQVAKEVEGRLVKELSESPKVVPASPLGPMSDQASRKLLIRLIVTMNSMFPDYDFRNLKPEQFSVTPNYHKIIHSNVLTSVERVLPGTAQQFWKALEDVIAPADCQVYTYLPGLPKKATNLWTINFFFYNHKLKRILFFTCAAVSKLCLADEEDEDGVEDSISDGEEEDDEEEGEDTLVVQGIVDASLLDPEEFGMTTIDLPSSTWYASSKDAFGSLSQLTGQEATGDEGTALPIASPIKSLAVSIITESSPSSRTLFPDFPEAQSSHKRPAAAQSPDSDCSNPKRKRSRTEENTVSALPSLAVRTC